MTRRGVTRALFFLLVLPTASLSIPWKLTCPVPLGVFACRTSRVRPCLAAEWSSIVALDHSSDMQSPFKGDELVGGIRPTDTSIAGQLNKDEVMRLSREVQRLRGWEETRGRLSDQLGRPCREEEVASVLQLGVTEYRTAMQRMWQARSKLISANLPLVLWVAKKYANLGVERADLIQEGAIGLIAAAEKFDPGRGYRFSSYATWWVRDAMTKAVAKQSRSIRLPMQVGREVSRLRRAKRDLASELNRAPTELELAERLGLSPKRVRSIERAAAMSVLSMDGSGRGSTSAQTLGETLPDERGLTKQLESATRHDLGMAVESALTEREAAVVRLRYGLCQDGRVSTIAEAAMQMGISSSRAWQLEVNALEKLRGRGAHVLSEYSP